MRPTCLRMWNATVNGEYGYRSRRPKPKLRMGGYPDLHVSAPQVGDGPSVGGVGATTVAADVISGLRDTRHEGHGSAIAVLLGPG